MATNTERATSIPLSPPRPPVVAGASELALAFKALSDPTRVQMVSLLLAAGTEGLCVCDIGAYFPLGQPTISHHLKLLKAAGLASAARKGLWVYYAARPERLAALGIALPICQQTIRRSACYDGPGSRGDPWKECGKCS